MLRQMVKTLQAREEVGLLSEPQNGSRVWGEGDLKPGHLSLLLPSCQLRQHIDNSHAPGL